VFRVRFNENGKRLAADHFNGAVSMWDLDAPPAAGPLRLLGLELQAVDVAFHPRGRWLAATGSQMLTLWPLARAYPQILRGHTLRILGIAFGPDGRWIASSSWDGSVRVWSLQTASDLPASAELDTLVPSNFQGLAVDPLGRWLLTVSDVAQLVSVEGDRPRQLQGLGNFGGAVIWGLTFSPDGRYAAVGGGYFQESNAVVRMWDVESGDLRVLDPRDGKSITDLAITSEGRLIAAGVGGLRVWNLESGESRLLRDRPVWKFELSPDESSILAVDYPDVGSEAGGRAMLLDLEGTEIASLDAHGERVRDVAFDSTGNVVITGGKDGALRVGPVDGSEPHLLLGHQGAIWTVDVSADDRWIGSAGDDGDVRLWLMPEGRPFHTLPYREFIDRLRSLTNVRVVEDQDSPTGYRLDADPFPGWETAPAW
jgi:WD40 repeat protein